MKYLAPNLTFCLIVVVSDITVVMAVKTVETGSELLARLGTRVPLSNIVPELFGEGSSSGEIIEFFGEEGTGKTELLLNLITRCILPKVWQNIPVDGPESKVVFISTDYKFSILRLVLILEKKITKILQSHFSELSQNANDGDNVTKPDMESEVQLFTDDCLQRVQVVYCSSSWQLFLTLHSLEYQLTTDASYSLLVIDSISTFYWLDRFCANDNISNQGLNIRRITKILKKFVNDLNISVIATKLSLFKPKYSDNLDPTNNNSLIINPNAINNPGIYSTAKQSHTKYLDKVWENFVCKRWVFTVISAAESKFCLTGTNLKTLHFTITESGVKFL
eukprot:XP_014785045.1 PREDICTED: DNA repair protein XRCC2-like [Octopus bimaculoides]